MSYSIRLRVPALGDLEVVGEIDLPAEVLSPAPPRADLLDDDGLRERWKVSARTLKRLRDRRALPFLELLPHDYRYRREDVEAYEAERLTAAAKRRTR